MAMDLLDCRVLHLYHCDMPAEQRMAEFPADGLFSTRHTEADCRRKHHLEKAPRYAHPAAKPGESPPTLLDLADHAKVQHVVMHGTALYAARSKAIQKKFRGWVLSLRTSGLTTWVAADTPNISAPPKPKVPA